MQRPGSSAKRAREASTGQRGTSGPARTASSPTRRPSSCSSHPPLAGQQAQTWWPPAKSISATASRWARSGGVSVNTRIPLRAGVTQAGTGRSSPSTSTRQTRQLATSDRPSMWQRDGSGTPIARQASSSVAPGGAGTGRPSMIRFPRDPSWEGSYAQPGGPSRRPHRPELGCAHLSLLYAVAYKFQA